MNFRKTIAIRKKIDLFILIIPFFLSFFLLVGDSYSSQYILKNSLFNDQNQDYIINKLAQNGITFDSISPIYTRKVKDSLNGAKKLFKRELIIGKDTLKNIDITLVQLKKNKTKIYFNGMDVSENLSDEKLEKEIKKYYKNIFFNELMSKL